MSEKLQPYKAKLSNMRELSTTHTFKYNSGKIINKRRSIGKSEITYNPKARNSISRNINEQVGKNVTMTNKFDLNSSLDGNLSVSKATPNATRRHNRRSRMKSPEEFKTHNKVNSLIERRQFIKKNFKS
mmetsp:Transcript_21578/g.19146  ORF Transcript_21578/g.19146 Transcript_21578/m.19146 type:complete len:129 (+) Transcript_21578:125-511(+)